MRILYKADLKLLKDKNELAWNEAKEKEKRALQEIEKLRLQTQTLREHIADLELGMTRFEDKIYEQTRAKT